MIQRQVFAITQAFSLIGLSWAEPAKKAYLHRENISKNRAKTPQNRSFNNIIPQD